MSDLFKLNDKDFIRGLIVTVFSSVLALVVKLLENNGFSLTLEDLKAVLLVGIISGLSYLLKNFTTDKDSKLGGKLKIG
jgi:hypothetical protein